MFGNTASNFDLTNDLYLFMNQPVNEIDQVLLK